MDLPHHALTCYSHTGHIFLIPVDIATGQCRCPQRPLGFTGSQYPSTNGGCPRLALERQSRITEQLEVRQVHNEMYNMLCTYNNCSDQICMKVSTCGHSYENIAGYLFFYLSHCTLLIFNEE